MKWHAPKANGYMVFSKPGYSVVCPITDIEAHDVYSETCHCGPDVVFESYMHLVHHSFEDRANLQKHLKSLGIE